jgi:hypothetical protein
MNPLVFHKLMAAGFILLPALTLGGCGIIGDDVEATAMNTEVNAMDSWAKVMPGDPLFLYEGGQFTYNGEFGSLKIAAGNYRIMDYVTDEGEKKHGQTVIFWLGIEDRPETSKAITVYIGQIILYEGYKIQVVHIGTNDRGRYTQVVIANAE